MFDKTVMKRYCFRWSSWKSSAMELCPLDSAESHIDGVSVFLNQGWRDLASCWYAIGKLMISNPTCKLQLNLIDKFYPQLAYRRDKDYIIWRIPRTPNKNISDYHKTYMGAL